MRLKSFRIRNFRSIADSGFCDLSHEKITVLVGQNEAGKSSVLEALMAWQNAKVLADDLRNDGSFPIIDCCFEVDRKDVEAEKAKSPDKMIFQLWAKHESVLFTWQAIWQATDNPDYELTVDSTSASTKREIINSQPEIKALENSINATSPAPDLIALKAEQVEKLKTVAEKFDEEATDLLADIVPTFILFRDENNLLPSIINIEGKKLVKGVGHDGAQNFLKIADIDLPKLLDLQGRQQETKLASANRKVTALFQSFWTQTVGKAQKLELTCQVKNHSYSAAEDKKGKAYLTFFISDSDDKLHPNQRSQGVRWYVSFFLQLCATSKSSEKVLLLLDEPGANLHAKAQADVLRVIEASIGENQVIYSTHSPDLVRTDRLGRVLAVQRADQEDDNSPTEIIGAHKLSSASIDTLSAIYRAMGIDFSRQQVIQKTNNVLLEELSAMYYLKSFWFLAEAPVCPNFLPATGVSNIPQLANLLTGWGIEFLVAVDDDKKGREIRDELTENLFFGNADAVSSRFYRFTGCRGIEDIFEAADFYKYVLRESKPEQPDKKSNSDAVRTESKALLAYQFCTRVSAKEILITDLTEKTGLRIRNVVNQLDLMIANYPK